MGSVNIAIKDEAYEFLKSMKTKDESFSEVILKFKEKKGSKENIMKYFGVLANDGIDWDEKEKRMKEFRDEVEERFKKTAEYMEKKGTPMIALDTTAIIDIFKKDKNLKKLLDNLNDSFATTVINYEEIRIGLNPKDAKYNLENNYYENFFKDLIFFDFDKISARKSSDIFWDLSARGQMIGNFDCMIGGTLLANGVNTIITKNVKHFEKIKELKVLKY